MPYPPHDVIRTERGDGTIHLRARAALGPVTARTTDWLDHWAEASPQAIFLAEREGAGWRTLRYGAARDAALGAARLLHSRGLTAETPVLILTGNSIAHALIALGAQYVGVPIVPLAEQYAAIHDAHRQIDAIAEQIRPGAVFVEDLEAHGELLDRPALRALPHLSARDLDAAPSETDVDIGEARRAVGPDTVAKILMTSGSTSAPKGVRTTHRMMCSNQAQIAQCLPFLRRRPPVLVDWLPWNHVFGGSHNFNLVLANGGTLYIDDGKPTPDRIARTLENNRLKQGTISFNVPVGFAALRDAMGDDPDFAEAFFRDLDMLFYAGASLPQDVWDDLHGFARAVRGDVPLFTSSWGLTETAPACLLQHQPGERSGTVGVPLPGVEVKLVPASAQADRYEVRVTGPNVFAAYHNDPDRSAEAFDSEGYFRTGDAMSFVDPSDPDAGLRFEGRLSEDFKLTTGTWVRAAALRLEALGALTGLAQDLCLVGEGRAEIGALIVPTSDLRHGAVPCGGALQVTQGAEIAAMLSGLKGGSARRITRALVLADPPSIADGEITAKGNLNFPRLLMRRTALVDRLYDDADPATIRVRGT